VDDEEFSPDVDATPVRQELQLADDTPVVCFMSRLYEFKDPITFVKAIPHVADKRPDARFLVVGDGALRGEVDKLVASLDLGDRVRVTGPRQDANRILAASDVFVALSPVENVWSQTIVEATYTGIPCILTDAGRTGRVFTHDKDCLLVPPKDEVALAGAIVRILDDPPLGARIVGQALDLHREHGHNNTEIVQRHLGVYLDATSTPAGK
jgi:glycosyltransferase involved in cell wall biosynthesis